MILKEALLTPHNFIFHLKKVGHETTSMNLFLYTIQIPFKVQAETYKLNSIA